MGITYFCKGIYISTNLIPFNSNSCFLLTNQVGSHKDLKKVFIILYLHFSFLYFPTSSIRIRTKKIIHSYVLLFNVLIMNSYQLKEVIDCETTLKVNEGKIIRI